MKIIIEDDSGNRLIEHEVKNEDAVYEFSLKKGLLETSPQQDEWDHIGMYH